jgi:hypothetical protein
MFAPVLESASKIAGATVEMQQEMIRKWFSLWPTIELWQKCVEAVRQASEAQLRDFQAAAEKWFELMTTPFPTS